MNEQLKVEQKIFINADAVQVWDALTNPELISKYMFGTKTTSEWKVGSEIVFEGEYQGKPYRDGGVILALQPELMLKYSFEPGMNGEGDGQNGYKSVISFNLSKFASGTELQMVQEGFRSMEQKRDSEVSWDEMLHKLKELVESN